MHLSLVGAITYFLVSELYWAEAILSTYAQAWRGIDEGFRSAWYQLEAGMHMNADPADQVNAFHTLIVVTRGAFTSKIGGRTQVLNEGQAVFVPRQTAHEFWANDDQYGEMVMLMVGESAERDEINEGS